MRTHAQEEGLLETGVWPAVADMLLLLASIFILATVAAAATASPSKGDAGRDRLLAVTYHIPEGLLFPSGKATLIDPTAAEQVVRSILEDAPGRIQALREVASQAWPSFYVVIEAAGHTDFDALPSRAVRGADGNWELSAQRASMVVHLVEQAAADPRLREALGIRGEPTDEWEGPARSLRERRCTVVACAAGPEADAQMLKTVTETVVQIESLKPEDLKAFFKWVSSSIRTSSQALDTVPAGNQTSPLPPPPPEVRTVP